MHFFPTFDTVGKSSSSQFFGLDPGHSGRTDPGFTDVFNTFMRSNDGSEAFHGSGHDLTPQRETPLPASARTDPAPLPVRDDPPASVHQRDLQADREDFARLRERLESLGVDKDVLDRAEELFDRPGPVTWGQVYDVLREPLEKKDGIKLTDEQAKDILNLLERIGFSTQDAKALLNDLLNNRTDSAWKQIQQMVAALKDGDNIFVALREIASLLKALGLDIAEMARAALKKLDPETLAALQKVLDAALKGEIALDQDSIAAMKKAIQSLETGIRLDQFAGEELSPDELRKLLAMIKEAADAGRQNTQAARGEILAAMAAAENKEQRMSQADRMDAGVPGTRLSQGDPMNVVKGSHAGSDSPEQHAGRNDQQNANSNAFKKSSQGWESFWEKVNVNNSNQGAAAFRDAGPDPRPVIGQAAAATAAENAASRAVNNAPAPHRTVLHQVHSGILNNMGQGRQQLTLHLTPPELGSLTVNLKVVGKEVQAVLRADTPEARQIIAENLHLVRQSMEANGLRVTKLEVQAQLQENSQFTQHWQGADGQKFQEQGSKTQWGALGRGQTKEGAAGKDDAVENHVELRADGREGGIDLIA